MIIALITALFLAISPVSADAALADKVTTLYYKNMEAVVRIFSTVNETQQHQPLPTFYKLKTRQGFKVFKLKFWSYELDPKTFTWNIYAVYVLLPSEIS